MSINFESPMDDTTKNLINKIFGDKVAAYDEKTVLLEGLNKANQSEFKALANVAKQPVTLELHEHGDIKEMSDGTRYQVTSRGWEKI